MITPFLEEKLLQMLDWTYTQALNGTAISDSAIVLAQGYLHQYSSVDEAIDSLIKHEIIKATGSGLLSGLGGGILLPITIPANTLSVLFLQIRMIIAIAYLAGLPLTHPQIKLIVYSCLCQDVLKTIFGKITLSALLKPLTEQSTATLLSNILLRLSTQFSKSFLSSSLKMIPLLGGIINGGMDYYFTSCIAENAKTLFLSLDNKISADTPAA